MDFIDRIFKKKEEKPIASTPEMAWASGTFFGSSSGTFTAYEGDDLKTKKGRDIYRKMLRDPQVKAAYLLVVDSIVSRDFVFQRPDDSDLQKEIEAFFWHCIESTVQGTFVQGLKNILLAKAYGFSVTEKVYESAPYKGTQRWVLKALKARPGDSFIFEQDAFGNLVSLKQDQNGAQQTLDPQKFIVYQNLPELDPIFGESDLRSAYRAYWEKDIIQKFWSIYLEREAGGFTVATAGVDAPPLSPEERRIFQNILRNLSQSSSLLMPAGYTLESHHGYATDAYERAIAEKNKEIAKALLVPALLGFSEQGSVGSYSQSQTQADAFGAVIKSQCDRLADALNEGLFKELAAWNFGVSEFPKFRFESLTSDRKREMATAWADAVQRGAVSVSARDEQRTRELLQYPFMDEDEGHDEDEKKEVKQEPETEKPILEPEEPAEYKASEVTDIKQKLDSPWVKRVNFAAAIKTFDTKEEEMIDALRSAVGYAVSDSEALITDSFDELKDIELAEIMLTDAFKSHTESLKKYLSRVLEGAYGDGREQAKAELLKASKTALEKAAVKKIMAQSGGKAAGLGRDTALAFAEGIDLLTAEDYFASKAFAMAGDLTDDIKAAVKQAILSGIRDEKSIREIITLMQEILVQKGILPGEDISTTPPRLETIARTTVAEAFAQARLSVYHDPELEDFVQGLEYSAILDSRTTDFCRSYDGKRYKKSDPIWSTIVPPNHFRCRSVLIPITLTDGDVEYSDPLDIKPAKGFA